MADDDFALALQLSQQFAEEESTPGTSKKSEKFAQEKPLSIVDPSWELIDPVPDIRELFVQFNAAFFSGQLAGVEVKWSSRMTLCAGVCCYQYRAGYCCIKLSQPLLKLRPRKDLVETLLHEMIHALLFVTQNNKDHDGHGPEFHKHMYRINNATGTNISVYHSFHDEVNNYRQHWWKCNGACARRPPFFGVVRRAMNRAPSARDPWWSQHMASCGGTYQKIKEPDGYKKKGEKKSKTEKSETMGQTSESKKTGSVTKNKNMAAPAANAITNWFKNDDNEKPKTDGNNGQYRPTKVGGNDKNDPVKSKITSDSSGKLKSKHEDLLRNNTFWNNKTVKGSVKSFGEINSDSGGPSANSLSSKNASSNVHGFLKQHVETLVTTNNIALFSGPGQKLSANVGDVSTRNASFGIASKSARRNVDFLKRLESDSKKRKLTPLDSLKHLKMKINDNTNKAKSNILKNSNGTKSKAPIQESFIEVPTNIDGNEAQNQPENSAKALEIIELDDGDDLLETGDFYVDCPACPSKVLQSVLNQHLDICLS